MERRYFVFSWLTRITKYWIVMWAMHVVLVDFVVAGCPSSPRYIYFWVTRSSIALYINHYCIWCGNEPFHKHTVKLTSSIMLKNLFNPVVVYGNCWNWTYNHGSNTMLGSTHINDQLNLPFNSAPYWTKSQGYKHSCVYWTVAFCFKLSMITCLLTALAGCQNILVKMIPTAKMLSPIGNANDTIHICQHHIHPLLSVPNDFSSGYQMGFPYG